MKFERIQLGIKIGSLGDEARRIKNREITLLNKASRLRATALFDKKGLDENEAEVRRELKAELDRRVLPQLKAPSVNPGCTFRVMDRVARKTIRKYLRDGLTKEEILALPGVQKGLKYTPIYESLRRHRKGPVRHEARHAQLALSFLRERAYSKTEDKPTTYPNWDKIVEIAKRFSMEDGRILMQRFEQWSQEATQFIRGRELMLKPKQAFTKEPLRVAA